MFFVEPQINSRLENNTKQIPMLHNDLIRAGYQEYLYFSNPQRTSAIKLVLPTAMIRIAYQTPPLICRSFNYFIYRISFQAKLHKYLVIDFPVRVQN